ncbi:MAG: Gfo/Idh/MocA family oxidoreductase [Oscillospiraceae bacterium]|nr:Gfo/Idh/MocA family oxidoreductase [Oscillospiraceae bacterium]
MRKLNRVLVLGTGYWANFQIPAWQSLGVEVSGVWNRSADKAKAAAERFKIKNIYPTLEEAFASSFDIADIIVGPEAHERLVMMAAAAEKHVICQKPMADTLPDCERMVKACEEKGLWYAVHENFRYQPPIIAVKEYLPFVGKPVYAHIQLKSPDREIITVKQPALMEFDHLCLRDMGPHIFDVARYYFGEAESIYTVPATAYPDLNKEDTTLSLLRMKSGIPVFCQLSHDFMYKVFIKGENGTLTLTGDHKITLTNSKGSEIVDAGKWDRLNYIPDDDWVIHGGHVFASIPLCLAALKNSYESETEAETSGKDNLKTMKLMFAAIKSVEEGRVVRLDEKL